MRFSLSALVVLVMLSGLATGARAQETLTMGFDIRYGPLRPAEIAVHAQMDAETYSVRADVESTGIVGLIRDFHFRLATIGTRDDAGFDPQRFNGDINTGWHHSRVDLRYADGLPQVISLSPPVAQAEWALDPATQGGTVDPLTALFMLARPRARGALCGISVEMFDGRRRGRLSLAAPIADGASLRCAGVYRRVGGFAPEDMVSFDRLAFDVVFETDAEGLWHLMRGSTQTPYGRMRFRRR